MIFSKVKMALILCMCISGSFAFATQTPPPFALLEVLTLKQSEKSLIMVLDVKQEEYFLDVCGNTMITALKDKVAPIIASAHSLQSVRSEINPTEWHIYQNKNLLLFVPKDYLKNNQIKTPHDAGFNLAGWKEKNLDKDPLPGLDKTLTIDGLSKQSVDTIRNRWIIKTIC